MILSTLPLLLLLFQVAHFVSYEAASVLDGLKSYSQLDLPHSVFGSESAAFDCHGKGPYVGVSDGRILKWHDTNKHWIDFAVTSPHRYIYTYINYNECCNLHAANNNINQGK